ncbi:MAG: hypothetical protein V7746_00030 [Halioglobus sp.]
MSSAIMPAVSKRLKAVYILRLITAALMLLCLPACSQYFYDLGEPLVEADLPVPEMHLQLGQVLAALGPPQRMSAVAGGYVLAWEHWEIQESKFGLSLGFAGAEALSVDVGDARVKGEFMLLGFNNEHQLVDSVFSEWDNNAGGGQSLQPLGGLLSVVDVDDLLEIMPQHGWGATSLSTLPVSLNRDNQPDTGANGIEQRGTPTGLGQRTLEMD